MKFDLVNADLDRDKYADAYGVAIKHSEISRILSVMDSGWEEVIEPLLGALIEVQRQRGDHSLSENDNAVRRGQIMGFKMLLDLRGHLEETSTPQQ